MASTVVAVDGFPTSGLLARRSATAQGSRLTRRGRALVGLTAGVLVAASLGLAATRLAETADARPVPAAELMDTVSVVVQPGDSLWAIASRLNQSSDPREVVQEIRARNGLTSNRIMPGEVLVVPLHR
ncbi:MAG: LysM peptidoglycan-binding domain-containing protein [Candidatus Nanopelagicales bacterium]